MSAEKIYIVHWESEDKSEHGVVGVFDNEGEAINTYDLLESHGDLTKRYFLDDYALGVIVRKGHTPHNTKPNYVRQA